MEPNITTVPKHWRTHTSWAELPIHEDNGVRYQIFKVGAPGEEDDAATVVRAVFPPGARVEPHSHPSNYCEIILEGSEVNTRHEMQPGDISIVKAGTVYGPLVVGENGLTKLVIFQGSGEVIWAPNVRNG